MIVCWKGYFKRFALPRAHTYKRFFKILEKPAFAEHQGKIFGFATRELYSINNAAIINTDPVAFHCRPFRGFVLNSLLTQNLQSIIDIGARYVDHRLFDTSPAYVTECNVWIDLKCCAEFKITGILRHMLRFKTWITRDPQFIFAHSLIKILLQGVAHHLLTYLRTVLLRHNFQRHLAGSKTVYFCLMRQALQTAFHFRFDFFLGNRKVKATL